MNQDKAMVVSRGKNRLIYWLNVVAVTAEQTVILVNVVITEDINFDTIYEVISNVITSYAKLEIMRNLTMID